MKTKLTGIIQQDGKWYCALCPEVDVASQGRTVKSARKNLIEALELFFECASENEIKRRLHKELYIHPVEELQNRLAETYEIEVHPLGEVYVTPIEIARGNKFE